MNSNPKQVRHQEHYRYIKECTRVFKCVNFPAKSGAHQHQVRYLSGLELRTITHAAKQTENLHVITANGIRILHWQKEKPDVIENIQPRFSTHDSTGSNTLELDLNGKIISKELYYPFGGTAVWATKNHTDIEYKTIRYSGKERDRTGLIYCGYRYYIPWKMRWLNTDPAGNIDGMNRFRMVQNNPMTLSDPSGLAPKRKRHNSEPANFNIEPENKRSRFSHEPQNLADALARVPDKIALKISEYLSDSRDEAVLGQFCPVVAQNMVRRLNRIDEWEHNNKNEMHNHLIKIFSIIPDEITKYLNTADLQRLSQVSQGLKPVINSLQKSLPTWDDGLLGKSKDGSNVNINVDLIKNFENNVDVIDNIMEDTEASYFYENKDDFYSMIHIAQTAVMGETKYFPRQLTSASHTFQPINPRALQLTGFPLDHIHDTHLDLQDAQSPEDITSRAWYGAIIERDEAYKNYISIHYPNR